MLTIAALPWLIAGGSVALALVGVTYGLRERQRRKGRPLLDRSPVRPVSPAEVDPVFTPGPLGYSRETEAVLIGDTGATATTSDTEAWLLSVMAKRARRIFEFGTCTGRTTYLLARNAPAAAEVVTITLSPETIEQYQPDGDDPESARWAAIATRESAASRFFYEGTDVAAKITQILGDSKNFDETPFAGSCDLVFIDGSHAYSYVKNDTAKAFRMVRRGGAVVWHDFSPACAGVWRYLNELGRTVPLMHVRGTRLVVTKR
ncbi:MAG: class I SAM-dependent methyltransferase [Rhodospirillales bacterium]|nr:MAG: class I SAM-dependent methyltransferase [Rhodospirillales bacterium]